MANSPRPVITLPKLGLAAAFLACLSLPGCGQSGEQSAARPRTPQEDSVYLDSLARRRKVYEEGREEACRKVYRGEHAAFSNVVGWKYDNEIDGCWVIFKYNPLLTAAQCDSLHPPEETSFMKERLLCHEGQFRTRY